MGRRSDHSREELEALILDAGQNLMAQVGFAHFSAREVAKRIGYSVGTIMHLFSSVDHLVLAINSRTFLLWTAWLEERLSGVSGNDRIYALVQGYFDFAAHHHNLWSAIYEHRLPADMAMPDAHNELRGCLMTLVEQEIAAVLPHVEQDEVARLARSLVASVHGHCAFALSGSFALLGEDAPLDLAMQRVIDTLRAQGAPSF
ncbi:MAG: TetR/AcrR family transcriptional regulator [Sphingobium sp.]|nr:TetR/AcrR family transcriptional regulator [Sphingobium sp.]